MDTHMALTKLENKDTLEVTQKFIRLRATAPSR